MRRLAILLIGLSCLAPAEDPGRWRLQYFYDQEGSEFTIADLKFPSAQRGIAVGAITSEKSVKPMSAITTDGGLHWTLLPLKEVGLSLYFLNDGLGWMVTDKGLWQTEESGRSWRKLKAPSGIARVHFADPEHGWAVGARKQVWETRNGGADWTKAAFTDEVKSNPEHTQFAWIEFANKDEGAIGGWSRPPRRTDQRLPDWVEPDIAANRKTWPQLGIVASTRDGGKTWTPSAASIFGQITAARLSPEGWGIELVEFSDTFDWPSEVMFLNLRTGGQRRIYREKERKITDVAIGAPKGPVYLGGIEHFGKLQDLPVPRKVVIVRSEDAEHWTEMPVDYRAVARRVILAAAGGKDIWAATDTGMILKLAP